MVNTSTLARPNCVNSYNISSALVTSLQLSGPDSRTFSQVLFSAGLVFFTIIAAYFFRFSIHRIALLFATNICIPSILAQAVLGQGRTCRDALFVSNEKNRPATLPQWKHTKTNWQRTDWPKVYLGIHFVIHSCNIQFVGFDLQIERDRSVSGIPELQCDVSGSSETKYPLLAYRTDQTQAHFSVVDNAIPWHARNWSIAKAGWP